MNYLKLRQILTLTLQFAAIALVAAILILVCMPSSFYKFHEVPEAVEAQSESMDILQEERESIGKTTEVNKEEKEDKEKSEDKDGDKLVALTFDDGPTPTVTNRILDTLEKYNARATFFVVGRQVEHDKELLQRGVSFGCEIGNHSWEHKAMTKYSAKSLKKSLEKTNKVVALSTGFQVALVRPTYGSVNKNVKKQVGYPLIYWNVDTEDWKSRNVDKIMDKVSGDKVEDGDIILMHDTYPTSADAVEKIIPYLQKKGFTFVTVSELMAKKGVKLKEGTVYYNAK